MKYGLELIRKSGSTLNPNYRIFLNGDENPCPALWSEPKDEDTHPRFINSYWDSEGYLIYIPDTWTTVTTLFPDFPEEYKKHREEYIAHIKKLRVKDML